MIYLKPYFARIISHTEIRMELEQTKIKTLFLISTHMIIMGRVVPGSHMEQVSRPHRDVVGGKCSLVVLKLIMWVEDGRI